MFTPPPPPNYSASLAPDPLLVYTQPCLLQNPANTELTTQPPRLRKKDGGKFSSSNGSGVFCRKFFPQRITKEYKIGSEEL